MVVGIRVCVFFRRYNMPAYSLQCRHTQASVLLDGQPVEILRNTIGFLIYFSNLYHFVIFHATILFDRYYILYLKNRKLLKFLVRYFPIFPVRYSSRACTTFELWVMNIRSTHLHLLITWKTFGFVCNL